MAGLQYKLLCTLGSRIQVAPRRVGVSPALRQDSLYLVPRRHQSKSSHRSNALVIIDMAGLQYSLASLPAQQMVRAPQLMPKEP